MAGCFHLHGIKLKRRTRSLEHLVSLIQSWTPPDSPRTGQRKSKKVDSLYRSRSEEGLKTDTACARHARSSSPRGSHTPPRRRYARVVHDDEHAGEEYESPYIIRRYSRNYWEKQQEEARKIQESSTHPYNVNSDHTILKTGRLRKTKSLDCDPNEEGNDSLTTDRHPSFSNKVQVIEFVGKEKITKHVHHMHAATLVDTEEVLYEEAPPIKKLIRQDSKDEYKRVKESIDLVDDMELEDGGGEKELSPEKQLSPPHDVQVLSASTDNTKADDDINMFTDDKLETQENLTPALNINGVTQHEVTKIKTKNFHPHLKMFRSSKNSNSSSSKDSIDSDDVTSKQRNDIIDDVTVDVNNTTGKHDLSNRMQKMHLEMEVDIVDTDDTVFMGNVRDQVNTQSMVD